MARLIGEANETKIKIDGLECLALVDSGAQLSTITGDFAKRLRLPIHPLHKMIRVKATGGGDIPYLGYVEVNLKINDLWKFNEDVLMLVIKDSTYAQRVPIQLGTLHIDRVLDTIDQKEMKKLSKCWHRGQLASLLANKSAQFKSEEESKFKLDQVKGTVKLTRSIELKPFETTHVQAISKVKGHDQQINVVTENPDIACNRSVVTVASYTHLKPGSSKLSVGLKNLSSQMVTIKAKTVIAKVAAANVVPQMLAPRVMSATVSSEPPKEGDKTEPK